ncbi:MAG: hypothetical protein ACFE68_03825 [Candidatus Hodarchaeota archaeon]
MNDEKAKKEDKKDDKWEKDFSVDNILKPATGFPERSEELVFNEFAAEATRFLMEADQHAAKGEIDDAAEALCAAIFATFLVFGSSLSIKILADFITQNMNYKEELAKNELVAATKRALLAYVQKDIESAIEARAMAISYKSKTSERAFIVKQGIENIIGRLIG